MIINKYKKHNISYLKLSCLTQGWFSGHFTGPAHPFPGPECQCGAPNAGGLAQEGGLEAAEQPGGPLLAVRARERVRQATERVVPGRAAGEHPQPPANVWEPDSMLTACWQYTDGMMTGWGEQGP